MVRRRVLLGAVLGALFALGWWAGGSHAARGLYSGLDLFVEVLETVKGNYVDPVDTGKLVTGAMRGVARGLDPWSRYLDPEEFRAVKGTIQGAFDGIGASVDQRGGWPVVIAPIEGSPAWDAGLLPGDLITTIDGHSMFGMSPDEVSGRLRGPAGTTVVLTIARDDAERDLKLQRRRVTVKNVPYAFVAAPGVGYLRLAHFSAHAALDVAAAVDTLRAAGARALVLDLRGNPGGTIDEAVGIASQFLPPGGRVTSTVGRASGVSRDYDARAARSELHWPLAVLVDGTVPRPPRSWPARCRTTTAPCWWATRRSARAWRSRSIRCALRSARCSSPCRATSHRAGARSIANGSWPTSTTRRQIRCRAKRRAIPAPRAARSALTAAAWCAVVAAWRPTCVSRPTAAPRGCA